MRLDYVLLLMDTVNVSSQVRTIACRMYRAPVQYREHYLCNINNTPSSTTSDWSLRYVMDQTLESVLLRLRVQHDE
jgi:hypothetical protein